MLQRVSFALSAGIANEVAAIGVYKADLSTTKAELSKEDHDKQSSSDVNNSDNTQAEIATANAAPAENTDGEVIQMDSMATVIEHENASDHNSESEVIQMSDMGAVIEHMNAEETFSQDLRSLVAADGTCPFKQNDSDELSAQLVPDMNSRRTDDTLSWDGSELQRYFCIAQAPHTFGKNLGADAKAHWEDYWNLDVTNTKLGVQVLGRFIKEDNLVELGFGGEPLAKDSAASAITWREINLATDLVPLDRNFRGQDLLDEASVPTVHEGYQRAYTALTEQDDNQFVKWLSSNCDSNTTINIAGYSMGSALATLAAVHIQSKFPGVQIRVVTFGSPQVGCDKFKDYYEQLGLSRNTARLTSGGDPVPSLPKRLGAKNYAHVCKEVRLDGTGSGVVNMLYHSDPMRCHSLEHYHQEAVHLFMLPKAVNAELAAKGISAICNVAEQAVEVYGDVACPPLVLVNAARQAFALSDEIQELQEFVGQAVAQLHAHMAKGFEEINKKLDEIPSKFEEVFLRQKCGKLKAGLKTVKRLMHDCQHECSVHDFQLLRDNVITIGQESEEFLIQMESSLYQGTNDDGVLLMFSVWLKVHSVLSRAEFLLGQTDSEHFRENSFQRIHDDVYQALVRVGNSVQNRKTCFNPFPFFDSWIKQYEAEYQWLSFLKSDCVDYPKKLQRALSLLEKSYDESSSALLKHCSSKVDDVHEKVNSWSFEHVHLDSFVEWLAHLFSVVQANRALAKMKPVEAAAAQQPMNRVQSIAIQHFEQFLVRASATTFSGQQKTLSFNAKLNDLDTTLKEAISKFEADAVEVPSAFHKMSLITKLWLQFLTPGADLAYFTVEDEESNEKNGSSSDRESVLQNRKLKIVPTLLSDPEKAQDKIRAVDASCLIGDWRHWANPKTKLSDPEYFQRSGGILSKTDLKKEALGPDEYFKKKDVFKMNFKSDKMLSMLNKTVKEQMLTIDISSELGSKTTTIDLPYRPFMPIWVLRHFVSVVAELPYEDINFVFRSSNNREAFQNEYCVIDLKRDVVSVKGKDKVFAHRVYAIPKTKATQLLSNGTTETKKLKKQGFSMGSIFSKKQEKEPVGKVLNRAANANAWFERENNDLFKSALHSRGVWQSLEFRMQEAHDFIGKFMDFSEHSSDDIVATIIECAQFLKEFHELLKKFEPHLSEFLVFEDPKNLSEDLPMPLPWLDPSMRLVFVTQAISKYLYLVRELRGNNEYVGKVLSDDVHKNSVRTVVQEAVSQPGFTTDLYPASCAQATNQKEDDFMQFSLMPFENSCGMTKHDKTFSSSCDSVELLFNVLSATKYSFNQQFNQLESILQAHHEQMNFSDKWLSAAHALDTFNRTPLHKASQYGKSDVVNILIQKGADVHARDKYNRTPFHYASGYATAEISNVNILIQKGADVHARDKDNRTPLHYASWYGNADVVNILIQKGADVHARDKDNQTPLHLASKYGKADVVNILMKHGAKK